MAFDRRDFLRAASLSSLPLLMPAGFATASPGHTPAGPEGDVKFFGDGESFDPTRYLNELQKRNQLQPIEADRYGAGGSVAALEKKFQEITGKERAIFMPSGTMANQFAIAVLSGDKAKVFVQETSHVYRDEADAAQVVFNKRLIPLAQGETYFTAEQLQQSIDYYKNAEVFKSGMGCVSLENPVRRTDGKTIPFDEMKKISECCQKNNLRLHLDGARIYMAAAWSGVSIQQYSSLVDTIYISLYKYLGAGAGAVLCGSNEVIDKMGNLMKIHGGAMYRNWTNAAMALHRLDGMESRLKSAIARSREIFESLNKLPTIKINPLKDGTNIYSLVLAKNINGKNITETLASKHGIRIAPPDAANEVKITVNETLLYKEPQAIVAAFKDALG